MPVADPDNDDNLDLTLAPDNDIENQPVDFDPSNFGVIARTNVSRSMLSNFDFEFIFSRYIGRMVAIRRDPKVLSYLLPLSRHTSDKHFCLPSVILPQYQKSPKPSTSAIPNGPNGPNQSVFSYNQPVDHLVDSQYFPARAS